MVKSDLLMLLKAAIDELKLSIAEENQLLLLRYLDQLEKWNRTYNLTAIRDKRQMLVQHVFDSLAVVPVVNKVLEQKQGSIGRNSDSGASQFRPVIVDVGSGGGLPGVVLSIACKADVHCVDAVQKKMTFVQQMVGVLQRDNLFAHHQRIEAMPPFKADIVISRAFSSLIDFVELAGKHVAVDGVMLAMKGKEPEEEVRLLHAKTQWRVIKVEHLNVPELHAQRCVLHLTHQGG